MKKRLLVLGMAIICIFGMTACGKAADESAANTLGITEEGAINYADQVLDSVRTIVDQNMQEQYAGDAVVSAALTSWTSAMEDIGEFKSITDHEVITDKDGATINVMIEGTDHNAVVEILLDSELTLTGITTNVQYSFGELMEKAALNTILGMGTVFVVLILISLLSAIAPSANAVTQFSQIFGRDARYSGLINIVTMLLCIVTIPLLAAYYQM